MLVTDFTGFGFVGKDHLICFEPMVLSQDSRFAAFKVGLNT